MDGTRWERMLTGMAFFECSIMSWCLEWKKRVSFSAFAMTAHWWLLPRQGTFQVVSNLQTNCDILGGGTYISLAEVVASTLLWCHIHLNSPSSTRNNAKEYVECFFASFAWLNKNPRSLQSLASLMVKFSYTWHHMFSTFSSPAPPRAAALEMWFLGQPHQHYSGTCQNCKF